MTSEYRKAFRKLSRWFCARARVLPWRGRPTLYRVWISEIMLQQTTVTAVIPYYEKFLERFPDVSTLARASEQDVLRQWAGLGYYARARNLRKAARIIAREGFPRDRAGWLKLPGVGEYTAGAVCSIALEKPEPILDANVKRVLSRAERLPAVRSARDKDRYWNTARQWVEEAVRLKIPPSRFNQALMEIGALVCRAREPLCRECPLSAVCRSFRKGDAAYRPREKRKKWVAVRETVYAVMRQDRVLLVKTSGRWRQGLWDLPGRLPAGVKTAADKGLTPDRLNYTVTRHRVTRRIVLRRLTGPFRAQTAGCRWIDPGQARVSRLPLGAAAVKTLAIVREGIKSFKL